MTSTEIQIDSIIIGKNRRTVNDISALADSILTLDLLNPITVTKDLRLIAGLHRVEACKSLGWETIPAIVFGFDEVTAQLAEIDENLVRNELSVLERGEQTARRKDLYEAKFPQTKNGMRNGQTSKNADSAFLETPSFAKDTATKTNKSQRTIQTDVQIAKRIPESVRDEIRDMPLADNKSELLALTQMDGETQAEIVEQIKSGNATTVNQALNKIYPNAAKAETTDDTKSRQWIQRVVGYNDAFKVINERDGGVKSLTALWSIGSKREFLTVLETIVENYGVLAAELGEIIENEK